MSEKAFIRNLGHTIKDRDGNELNRDVTRVEYACRFYDFPVGQDTEVDADVARYVQSIHGGNGLNIVQPDTPPLEAPPEPPLEGIAAAAAALPDEPAPVEAPESEAPSTRARRSKKE